MKNAFEGSPVELILLKISEVKNRAMENTQSEILEEKKSERNRTELWGSIKWPNVTVIEISNGKREKKA